MADYHGISADQIRSARTLVRMTQDELAEASGVSTPAIKDIEQGKANPRMRTMNLLRRALEAAGVTFLAKGEVVGGGEGVRLSA